MVTPYVPVVVCPVVVMDRLLDELGLNGFFANVAVAPAGNPLIERVTGCVIPLILESVIVFDPDVPAEMDTAPELVRE